MTTLTRLINPLGPLVSGFIVSRAVEATNPQPHPHFPSAYRYTCYFCTVCLFIVGKGGRNLSRGRFLLATETAYEEGIVCHPLTVPDTDNL
ncbi:hypothetical protein BJ322DRAFT_507415 [Thelephora terrestris]|uniref:Uncharacterized protein n=1 Tax=Thelephora terrestris TaxID=56493 RepID=A0A9P6L0R6_9AGAM|nr:hypothetical protein BJ322DRAFT_507415 [Thelephora terrestris]